jgi:chemotaxis protein CheX
MDVNNEDVALLVRDVWSSIVGIDVHEAPPGSLGVAERSLTGFVHIEGEWRGTVTVEVTADLASEAAAAMFGLEPDELGGEEVDDSLGELANMIGGGVKSLLPGSHRLSLPTVVGGLDYEVNVPGAHPVRQLWFMDEQGRPVTVTVLESAGSALHCPTDAAPATSVPVSGPAGDAELVS